MWRRGEGFFRLFKAASGRAAYGRKGRWRPRWTDFQPSQFGQSAVGQAVHGHNSRRRWEAREAGRNAEGRREMEGGGAGRAPNRVAGGRSGETLAPGSATEGRGLRLGPRGPRGASGTQSRGR